MYGKGIQDSPGEAKRAYKNTGQESSKCLRCMSKPVWLEPGLRKGCSVHGGWGRLWSVGFRARTRICRKSIFPHVHFMRKKCKSSLAQEAPKAN